MNWTVFGWNRRRVKGRCANALKSNNHSRGRPTRKSSIAAKKESSMGEVGG